MNNYKVLYRALEEIENTGSNTDSINKLKLLLKDKEFSQILENSLNPRFNTFVNDKTIEKAILSKEKHTSTYSLLSLMQDLNSGKIKRGDDAIKETASFLSKPEHSDLDRKWIGKLLTGNLRIGINWKTLTKTSGIKKFEVMLAYPLKDENEIQYPCFVQPKLDGYRLILDTTDENKLKSRNGKVYNNFSSLEINLKSLKIPFVLDGEIMSNDFQKLQKSAFADKRGSVVGDIKYHVFDLIPEREWVAQKGNLTFSKRYELLKKLSSSIKHIELVECYKVNSYKEVKEYFKLFKSRGYEGIIIRLDAPYEFKRTKSLLKLKDFTTQDCKILEVVEGKGRLSGTTGALKVLQENGKGCFVGSGFNDSLRKEFWENKNKVLGKIIEVSYQELTPDGIMRFPTFVRFRDDKESKQWQYN